MILERRGYARKLICFWNWVRGRRSSCYGRFWREGRFSCKWNGLITRRRVRLTAQLRWFSLFSATSSKPRRRRLLAVVQGIHALDGVLRRCTCTAHTATRRGGGGVGGTRS